MYSSMFTLKSLSGIFDSPVVSLGHAGEPGLLFPGPRGDGGQGIADGRGEFAGLHVPAAEARDEVMDRRGDARSV